MEKRLAQLAIALTLLGLLVAVYMTIYAFTANDEMCTGSKDCSVVNASRYSKITIAGLEIPVADLGVAGYATMLAVFLLENKLGFFWRSGSLVFFGLSLAGFLFTLYLLSVEVALIRAYCPFWIASQSAMTLIFILSVIRVVRQPNSRRKACPVLSVITPIVFFWMKAIVVPRL